MPNNNVATAVMRRWRKRVILMMVVAVLYILYCKRSRQSCRYM
jgi:hypothetical protein